MAHVLEPVADRAARGGRPTFEKHAERSPLVQIVIAREVGEFEGVLRGAPTIAPHQVEHRRVHTSKGERADMREVRHPRLHAVDERNRAIDLAERPRHYRQVRHCADAGVLAEAKGQIVVAAGL